MDELEQDGGVMDRSEAFYLIDEQYTQDENTGIYTATQTKRKVYGNVSSVSASEWFEGSRIGLNPEIRLIMNADDYADERLAQFKGGPILSIYRVYKARNNTVELYAEYKKGPDVWEPPVPPIPIP